MKECGSAPQHFLVRRWPTMKPIFYTSQDRFIIRSYMDTHLSYVLDV